MRTQERQTGQEELTRLTAKLLSEQEEERRLLARQLHDDISQRLAAACINLSQLVDQLSGETAKSRCQRILSLLDALSEDIRFLSHELYPSALEHLGLATALQSLAREFEERESVTTRFSARDVPATLCHEVNLSLYRIVQEALKNVARHAAATSVDIAVGSRAEELYLSICDAGKGFTLGAAQPQIGLGLLSMIHRANLIGGTLDIDSEPGVGTRIMLHLPLSQG
jgi:signal transduction histidine kinase